jgi:hypothetical protein
MIAKANLFEPFHSTHTNHTNYKKQYGSKFSSSLAMDDWEEIGSGYIEK